MTLLAPLMMAGAAAVSIPIALHFFYRARYKPLPWAPMKFLKEAVEQTSRRLKFQEWILLALRCLAVALLALALARPAEESASAAGGGEPVDAVLVIDNSFSMDAKDGDKTRLDRAKEAALAVIDALPAKSSVQVYTCSDRPTFLGPVTRDNRDQAKQLVQAIEASALSTDLTPGVTEALAAAESGSASVKEIYLFTDMQKAGFDRQQSALRGKCDEIRSKPGRNLILIRCGNPERKLSNVAVTDITVHATIPHTKTRVPFDVTLKNTGREPIRGVKVSLELDGKAVEKDAAQIDQIDAGDTAKVTLTGSLDRAGPLLAAVHVAGDGLGGDNVLYKVVGVRDKVRVLLVAYPDAGHEFTTSGDWFVYPAFFPFNVEKDRDKIERYFIQVESASPAEAGPDKLNNKDVVYLLNAAARTDNPLEGMPPAFVARLADFVKRGGGLVIGCGDAVNPAAYNRVLGAAGAGLLPFPLKPEFRNTTEAAPFAPAPESIATPSVLTPPDDKERRALNESFRGVTITKMVDLQETGPEAVGGRVLMRTTDGKPLVASRVVGDGEVIFFATSLDEKWGRLMSEGSLAAPMTMYIMTHLTARKVPGGTRKAGDILTWHPPKQESGFELIKPAPRGDRSTDTARPRVKLGPAKEDGDRFTVSTGDTLAAGEYAIVPVGAPDPAGLESENGIAFAVNPDLRETENLDALADADVEKVLGYRPTIIQAGAGTEAAVRDRRTKGEWTEVALLFLLLLLVGEAAWAWFCGRAW
jgi:hypothetical protein